MRIDKVGICNMALSLAGAPDYIQSLDENSVIARRCKLLFEPCVEMVLRKHDWSSAATVTQLAADTSTPTTLYDHSYPIPFDCVKVVSVYGDADYYSPYDRWRIIGRNIETDLDTVYLKYVQMPEDYRTLDILLSEAIAYSIAFHFAPSYIKDKEMLQLLYLQGERALQSAKAADTLENKEAFTENSPWEDARNGEI